MTCGAADAEAGDASLQSGLALAGGAGRAEALRQVQLEMLRSNDHSLPY